LKTSDVIGQDRLCSQFATTRYENAKWEAADGGLATRKDKDLHSVRLGEDPHDDVAVEGDNTILRLGGCPDAEREAIHGTHFSGYDLTSRKPEPRMGGQLPRQRYFLMARAKWMTAIACGALFLFDVTMLPDSV
jgi:hypothetical protein